MIFTKSPLLAAKSTALAFLATTLGNDAWAKEIDEPNHVCTNDHLAWLG
jgi:hypothetical protein